MQQFDFEIVDVLAKSERFGTIKVNICQYAGLPAQVELDARWEQIFNFVDTPLSM